MGFVVQWLLGSLGLAVARRLVPGVHVDSTTVLVLASLALGLVNASVRPLLLLLTLPPTLLTVGLFFLVVNGVSFALAAAWLPGFSVTSVGAAVAGALIVSLVSLVMTWFVSNSSSS